MSVETHPESSYMIKGYVYIMANNRLTLYTGVTNNLAKRVYEHKHDRGSIFTAKYKLYNLVYYEAHNTIGEAIIREKQIKDMNKKDKILMIKKFNPNFEDLFDKVVRLL